MAVSSPILVYSNSGYNVLFFPSIGGGASAGGFNAYYTVEPNNATSHLQYNLSELANDFPREFTVKKDAIAYADQLNAGIGVNPNVAPQGTKTNINQNAVNSSNLWQAPGSSLNKLAQGIVANTNIDIQNSSLFHACDPAVNGTYTIFGTKFKVKSLIEANSMSSYAAKVPEWATPIIETITMVVKAVKQVVQQIKDFVEFIQKTIQEIQQFIEAVTTLINLIASLPAKLLALLSDCLTGFLADTVSLTASVAANNINNAVTS